MKAYLIPGSGEDLKTRDYRAVLNMYEELGYEPEFVAIDWKYKTIDVWVEQVKKTIPASDLKNSLLSGFSFGAMIALAVAAQTNPKQLLLFSLSPYFAEDFPMPKKYEKWAGKRKIENFKRFSMNELASKIQCPTQIFIGSKEIRKYSDMKLRASEAHKRIDDSRHIIVPDVGHDVGDPKYVGAIKKDL